MLPLGERGWIGGFNACSFICSHSCEMKLGEAFIVVVSTSQPPVSFLRAETMSDTLLNF